MRTFQRCFFCLTGLFLLCFSGNAQSETYDDYYKKTAVYGEILAAEKTKQGMEMLHFLQEKIRENPQNVNEASLWLRDHSVLEQDISKVNSLYFLQYSDALFFMAVGYLKAGREAQFIGLAETAMASLYTYIAMATADAKRCTDPSVLSALNMNTIRERFSAPETLTSYAYIPKERFDALSSIAVRFEEKFANRPPNKDICSMGMEKMSDLLKQPNIQKRDVPDPTFPGGHRTELISPPDYHFEPSYISDEEWKKVRAIVNSEQKEKLRNLYSIIQGKLKRAN